MKTIPYLLLTICALSSADQSRFEEYKEGTVCTGATNEEGKSGSDADYYERIKRMYTGCTYVLHNVDIHPLDALENDGSKTLDFLSSIKEVNGYVRIRGPMPKSMTELPLSNLTIIRGQELIRLADNMGEKYSLFLYNMGYLKSLNLLSLREISRGNVYAKFNYKNCYGENTNWDDIFQNPEEQTATVQVDSDLCGPVEGRCDDSCPSNNCWGPHSSSCQELNKDVCAEQCEYRCFGTAANECCHPECLAGCSGPTENDCWGCRNFYNNGTCVYRCPRSEIYNSTTFQNEKNPNAKVSFGKLCLESCPPGYLEFNEGCLLHTCPDGHKEKNGKCVPCDGACPHTCNWNELNIDWLTSEHVNDSRFINCTTVSGDVHMPAASFVDFEHPSDPWASTRALTVEDLKIFETVEDITGTFTFEPGENLPELKSLNVFRKLRRIGGSGHKGYSVSIVAFHITSLGLTSLEDVTSGAIYVQAPELCYTNSSALSYVLTGVPGRVVYAGVQPQVCVEEGIGCNEECTWSCVGPGDGECIGCSTPTDTCPAKCQHYELEDRCLANCDESGLFYASDRTCGRCHEECLDGCTGPFASNCTSCKNYKNQNFCVDKCPLPTYPDADKQCQPCNEICKLNEFGCNGPQNTIGDGGCEACDTVLLSDDNKSIKKCINSSCPISYYETTRTLTIQNQLLSTHVANKKCVKCVGECATCELSSTFCTSCKNFELADTTADEALFDPSFPKQKTCVKECGKNYYADVENKLCVACNDTCRGCTGPTSLDCIACNDYRVPVNGSSTIFECVADCPKELPYIGLDDKSAEKICLPSKPPTSIPNTGVNDPSKTVVIAVVVSLVFLAIIVALIALALYRRRRYIIERAEDYEKRNELALEPIVLSGAGPDLSRLRLINESELKKTVIIGSGAFGTVFKGFFIPDGEKVKIPVAIKVLIEGTTPAQSTELLDEARVMASVDHPCCIRILAVCMTAQMMLVTPLMPDGSLLSYIRANAGQLGSKVLINWCAQIARGMSHLQTCGIVHRDLAARNVLVDGQYQVKITDFGLAKLLDVGEDYYLAESGKLPIKWMALESIQHRIFNHKTDVWSYGVTLWELLTFGDKPYPTVKARDISMLLERGERLPQPNISTIDIYMILIKCWMLDANARPTFDDLDQEFTKMARDPGRYLVIDGDQLKRVPNSLKITSGSATQSMFSDINTDDEYPDKELVAADDYLSPSMSSAPYTRYENEEVFPQLTIDKAAPPNQTDDLHSPLRYTSSPTLAPDSEEALGVAEKLEVNLPPLEDYLEPNAGYPQHSAPSRPARVPSVDEDGYLQPNSATGYIDLLSEAGSARVKGRKQAYTDQAADSEESTLPLLSAENSTYVSTPPTESSSYAKPTLLLDSVNSKSNPTYVSNNNGSPTHKQAPPSSYENLDYMNQC